MWGGGVEDLGIARRGRSSALVRKETVSVVGATAVIGKLPPDVNTL